MFKEKKRERVLSDHMAENFLKRVLNGKSGNEQREHNVVSCGCCDKQTQVVLSSKLWCCDLCALVGRGKTRGVNSTTGRHGWKTPQLPLSATEQWFGFWSEIAKCWKKLFLKIKKYILAIWSVVCAVPALSHLLFVVVYLQILCAAPFVLVDC